MSRACFALRLRPAGVLDTPAWDHALGQMEGFADTQRRKFLADAEKRAVEYAERGDFGSVDEARGLFRYYRQLQGYGLKTQAYRVRWRFIIEVRKLRLAACGGSGGRHEQPSH